ncbi:MAG: DUF1573 domain-containing protein [bacterium]|nr:DUF1573 domain-containing protein [bacterium]
MSITKSTIYVVLLCTILAGGIIAIALFTSPDLSAGAEASSTGQLSFSENEWDFGTISMKDGMATKEIAVTNPTTEPITITSLETSCMCTTAQLVHENGEKSPLKGMVSHTGSPRITEEIQPGEHAVLRVQFDPNAHGPDATGPISRNVSLKTNSADQKDITLSFSGDVTK